jgi:putative ABC transport system permease protein
MLRHYFVTALRHFRQYKLTTAINVACLTIGLVCFLAIYAMVTYLDAGERHYANADRIYMITWTQDGSPESPFGSWLIAPHLKADFPELTAVARATFDSGFDSEMPVMAGDRKSFVHVTYADAEFLEVFALPFLAGEPKTALRSPRSVVLSKDAAIRLFDRVADAIGRSVRLQDGREVTVLEPGHHARGDLGSDCRSSHARRAPRASSRLQSCDTSK